MKKFFSILLLSIIINNSLFFKSFAQEDLGDEDGQEIIEDENNNLELIPDQNVINQINADVSLTQPNISSSCQLPIETILSILAGVFNKGDILRLLQQDLYLKSNPINIRSLLDLPSLQPYYVNYCGLDLSTQLFYNQTTRGIFTGNSPFIKSYINLENSALADELDLILEDIKEFGFLNIDIDIPQSLSLFKNMRLQERRLGLMFGAVRQTPSYIFKIRIPLFYHEHNFFLNKTEEDAIKNAPFFTFDGANASSNSEFEEFAKANLVNDRFGIGDTRLVILGQLPSTNCFVAHLGVEATIPTARNFINGLYGSELDPCKPVPNLKLDELINLFQCNHTNTANFIVQEFGKDAIRRLSTMLINVPLGNGGHFGFGPYGQFRNFIGDYIYIHTQLEWEFFSTRKRPRFFIVEKNPADFNRNLFDESKAKENLAFINEQLVNTFFPRMLCVDVKPGFLIKAKQAYIFDNGCWNMGVGADFWYQNQESLSFGSCPNFNLSDQSINAAIKPLAYQIKIFSHIGYFNIINKWGLDWNVIFTNDFTLKSEGISNEDFTMALTVAVNF